MVMRKKSGLKIFYLMNVDWGWIKQRPHFLAEKLAITNKVTLVYPYSWRRKNLTKNQKCALFAIPLVYIPFGRKAAIIKNLNNLILRLIFGLKVHSFR